MYKNLKLKKSFRIVGIEGYNPMNDKSVSSLLDFADKEGNPLIFNIKSIEEYSSIFNNIKESFSPINIDTLIVQYFGEAKNTKIIKI